MATRRKKKTLDDAVNELVESNNKPEEQPKKKRKRRTKKEMEEARRLEAEKKLQKIKAEPAGAELKIKREPKPEKVLSVHPYTINDVEPYDVGVALSELRYDAIAEMLKGLTDGLQQQIDNDINKGMVKVPSAIDIVKRYIRMSIPYVNRALSHSRHKMDMDAKTNLSIKV